MKITKTKLLAIFAFILLYGCDESIQWYQYLGPNRNSTAEGSILHSWGKGSPQELWSFPLGEGYGGASIFGTEVFILDREKGTRDILRCVDLQSGSEKWSFAYAAEGELPFPGSRAVPTVDKKYIWSVGPLGDFYCLSKKNHKPVWHHDIRNEFESEMSPWGFSQSPLIYKDLVIIAPQGKVAGVAAFNKYTGDPVWNSRPLTGYNFHVSPALANFGGINQVIMISPYSREDSTVVHEVVSFNADTGEELWTYHGLRSFATIAPPAVISDSLLLLTDCSYNGNYGPVTVLLEVTKNSDDFRVNELFLTTDAGCKMHPGVFFEDHIYLNSNGQPNRMQCLDMKGSIVWEQDSIPGFEMGGLILVDGYILNQDGKNGDIYLIEPSPTGYIEKGRAGYFNSTKTQAWAPLAFSQGKLILRDLEKMVCIDLQNLAVE